MSNATMTDSGQHEYTAALRVFSETLRLAELRAILGEPTRSHDIGDPVGRAGAVQRHAYWGLEAHVPRIEPLDRHLEPLLVFVEEKADAFDVLRPKCRSIDICCGVFADPDAQGGREFTPELSERLTNARLLVLFDLYGT